MTTLAKRGTGTPTTTGTTWTTVTSAVDGTPPANPATYAVWTSTTSGATATIEVTGYDFSTIPTGSTINSVTVNLRHFENNATRIPTISWQVYDGASTIGAAQTVTVSLTAADVSATRTVTLAQLKSATFKVRATATRAAVTQSATFNVDHIDVTVDYTAPIPAITQAAYRWYDDGTETGSVALAAQDTAASGDVTVNDGIGQLRVRLQSTDATALAATDDWQLQWEKNTSGTWTAVGTVSLVDSYPEANYAADNILQTAGTTTCQSFLGDGGKLTRAGFWLGKTGALAGNISASLYAHTGTFGGTGTGTGTVLATSTSKTVASLAASSTWVDFDFDGSVTLTSGTPYVVGVTITATGDISNNVLLGIDNTSPTHAGSSSARTSGGVWSSTTPDRLFRVYAAHTVVGYNSASLTDGAATTNRLTGGTGSFVAGKVSETGLVSDFSWSANNYTELVYSIDIVNTDVANGDTLKFRVLRNGATTGFTYTQVPTINIAKAAVTVNGTGTGTIDLTGAAAGVPEAGGTAVTATATGTITLSGVAAGVPGVTATTAGTITLSGVAVGQKTVTATAAGTVTVTGPTVGIRGTTGTAAGTLTVTGTASGQKSVTATAAGSMSLTGTAVGSGVSAPVLGTAAGSLAVSGSASGVPGVTGTAAGSLSVTGTAVGRRSMVGTATGTISITSTASGAKTVGATATGTITVVGVGLGQVKGAAVGTCTGQLTLTGSGSGTRGRPGVATATITITATVVGRRGTTATAVGTLTVTGVAAGVRGRPGVAAGQLTITGTSVGVHGVTAQAAGTITLTATAAGVMVDVAAIGQWNGTDVVAMRYGNQEVVEWMMV